jgi:hypothetical protein
MPFDSPFPRSFSASSIREYAPASSGVYGISNASQWLLIDETDNLQSALLAHLSGVDASLRGGNPTGFVIEICDISQRAARRQRLSSEYHPSCQGRSGQSR